jgi:hypothetical protein
MPFTRERPLQPATDRPAEDDRGPDCLVPVLSDFLTLDLRSLSPEAFESWMSAVADCLWKFAETDLRSAQPSLGARAWFRLVTDHLTRYFPDYPGGPERVRTDLACLMVYRKTLRQETC